ncbi:hypothetical protein [Eubacterium ventriosum]|uniref:hypothetical protein n=1 Tax=Eubacterium ventriosum TaxID=39496 RepID=UPI001C01E031|nr:hypothetical protein [Eubacterium ventriosum]MBT9699422.1 hypothetical protein [Eubacterium ventriosum]
MSKKVKKNIEKQGKNSFVNYIISKKELITIMIGLCATLYPIVNTVYKIMYQNECEKFYGIPGKYFDSDIDNRLLYLLCIIILLFMGIMPTLLKKYYEKKDKLTKGNLVEAIFLSVIIGIELGCINVYNLIEIMKQTYRTCEVFQKINNWLDNHAYFTVTVVIILGSISVLGLTLMKYLKNIKCNIVKSVVCVILSVSLIASLVVMVYGTIFKLSISIKDKSKYEFVMYNEEEYVVLSTYEEKILIIPFEIDEKEQYIYSRQVSIRLLIKIKDYINIRI